MQRIDIGIIGGGASGLMAAVAAADSVKEMCIRDSF